MNYFLEFRDGTLCEALYRDIEILSRDLPRTVRIMEVCGTHTMSIGRYGIRSRLPSNIDLISGPGCPVCVTDDGYIDAAMDLALKGFSIVTFGDMLKVPGSRGTLSQSRAEGAKIHVCYSPLEALELARKDPSTQYVFLAVGFETTTGPVVGTIPPALKEGIKNLSFLTAFKTVPNALKILAALPGQKIDAFLCPAHVSAIIGSNAYEPLVSAFHIPAVIGGFEPLDILLSIAAILKQIISGDAQVENLYKRVVKPQGNQKAQDLINRYLVEADVPWRGLGVLPATGLKLRDEYTFFDTEKRFGLQVLPAKPRHGCRCGDVLQGLIKPDKCAHFGKSCTPSSPIGPCMVSSEGSCAAWYKYEL